MKNSDIFNVRYLLLKKINLLTFASFSTISTLKIFKTYSDTQKSGTKSNLTSANDASIGLIFAKK